MAADPDLARRVMAASRSDAGTRVAVADTGGCRLAPTLEPFAVTGPLRQASGLYHVAAAIPAADAQLFVFFKKLPRPGRIALRARRDPDDFTRDPVVEISSGAVVLDAASGTLVIDEAKGKVITGHLEDLVLRERDEVFAYVQDGCASQLRRVELRFDVVP